MPSTPVVLQEATLATASDAGYTSTNCVTLIDAVSATNEGVAIAIATAKLLSPDGKQVIAFSKAIQPGASWPFPLVVGQVLAIGGQLTMACPTANVIRWRASGRQIT